MTFRVYRRHNRAKCDSKNPYEARCKCPLAVQFVWKNGDAVFEGKKLTYQNKWSLGTRSWSEAQSKVTALEKRLSDFSDGKVVPKGTTVEAALQEWYEFRDQNGLDNTKAKLLGGKLVEWCEKSNILLLTAITTDKIIKWRLTLPFRRETAASSVTVRAAGEERLLIFGAITNERSCRDALTRWLLRQTREHLVPRLYQLSLKTGLRFRRTFVKRPKTRWASCSRHHSISLNAKLLFLPAELVDYVMIHELCHLAEMNHSKRFWALVERHEPHFRKLDKQLRDMWKEVPRWAS